jgi:hypothetical protein
VATGLIFQRHFTLPNSLSVLATALLFGIRDICRISWGNSETCARFGTAAIQSNESNRRMEDLGCEMRSTTLKSKKMMQKNLHAELGHAGGMMPQRIWHSVRHPPAR